MSGGLGEQEEASGPHWGWNLLLANAAGMLLCALIMDPSTQEGEVERGQLTILRGLFVLAAAGHVGVWALRAHLAADIVSATERWSSAPAELSLSSLVPQAGGQTLSRIVWGVVIGWGLLVIVGLLQAAPILHDLTFENGPLETLTVLSYLGAGGFAVASFRACSVSSSGAGLRRWIVLIAALGCFLIAAEETDWGQVYFNYETPESFDHANIQSDLSFHNLAPPGFVPGTRWANWLLRTLAFLIGGVVPLLIQMSAGFRQWMWAWQIPVPPVASMVALFASAFIPEAAELYERNNVGSELREVTIAVAVAFWMFTAWRSDRTKGA
ncbi:MAG: hypothetical protein QMC73_03965 [Myxococcota bacterium]|jgi:hypothetical protein